MKEKPGKYGIPIRMLTDSKTRYILSMELYAGKRQVGTVNENSPTAVVKRLISPINNSERNVRTDRYYTSIELVKNYGRITNSPLSEH